MGINWKRKIFHVLSSFTLLLIYKILKDKLFIPFLALLLVLITIWEVLRLKVQNVLLLQNLWFPLLKEREKRHLSDAFFFLLGIFLAALLVSGAKLEFLILVLGISDPLAGIIGAQFGRPFLKFKKSILGAYIFFFSSFLLGIFFLKNSLLSILSLSFFLTVVEFFTERDNFWIPFCGAIFFRFF